MPAARQTEHEACLDGRERERAERYRHLPSRKRFVAARGILKRLAGAYLGREANELSFAIGEHGKPYVSERESLPLRFNSTDSDDVALFAFCLAGEIGIDVEHRNRKVDHEALAKRKLSPREYSLYESAGDADERRIRMLSMWTRKEAYGKAIGVGINYKLNSIDLAGDGEDGRSLIIAPDGLPWEISTIHPDPDIIVSVVAAGAGWKYRGFRYPPLG